MKYILLIVAIVISQSIYAQMPGVMLAKEYSKEMAVYQAKSFLITSILKTSQDPVQFELDGLAAASSGELTSLVYNCKMKNMEGLLLCFYGNYWNENGTLSQGYGFKNLTTEKAMSLLNTIYETMQSNNQYLMSTSRNIYFQFDDIIVLLNKGSSMDGVEIRLFWNTFDAEWETIAFERTKTRFEKKIK